MTDISRGAVENIAITLNARDLWYESETVLALRAALDKAEETIRESALQYLSDTGQLMEQIAHLKEREEYLVDLLDRITDHQAVIDCLTLQELDEVSGAMAEYTKGVKDDLGT